MQIRKLQPFLQMPLTLFTSAKNTFRLLLTKTGMKNHKEKPFFKIDIVGKIIKRKKTTQGL